MTALRARAVEVLWTVVLVAGAVVGLATSEGEPACDGPFIWRVDDSLPPQCPSPAEALPAVAIAWAVGLVVIVAVRGVRRSGATPSAGSSTRT